VAGAQNPPNGKANPQNQAQSTDKEGRN
jgi:hypothetical protein